LEKGKKELGIETYAINKDDDDDYIGTQLGDDDDDYGDDGSTTGILDEIQVRKNSIIK